MISGLEGAIRGFGGSSVYLMAGGVEYEVFVPLNVYETMESRFRSAPLETQFLYIYHHFSNEEQRLFGFLGKQQREIFRALLDLHAVGPALALRILSHLEPKTLFDLCQRQDVATLCKIPGIGKKIAEMLVFEISKQKRKRFEALLAQSDRLPTSVVASDVELAMIALTSNLGYRESEVAEVLLRIKKEKPDLGVSELIREAFKFIK